MINTSHIKRIGILLPFLSISIFSVSTFAESDIGEINAFDMQKAEQIISIYSQGVSKQAVQVGQTIDKIPVYISPEDLYLSSYQLKDGGFTGENTDDYEYVQGLGDLDECNGTWIDEDKSDYVFFITPDFPYISECFNGYIYGIEDKTPIPIPTVTPTTQPTSTPAVVIISSTTAPPSSTPVYINNDDETVKIPPISAKYYRYFTGEEREIQVFTDQSDIQHLSAINLLYSRNILSGYADGSFKPENNINRAETLSIILKALEINPINEQETNFTDVPTQEWYTGYVNKARSMDIIKGYADGTFRPADTINQAELLKITLKSFGIEVGDVPTNTLPSTLNQNDWYASYYAYTLATELIDIETISPTKPVTREEFAELIYRLIEQQEGL